MRDWCSECKFETYYGDEEPCINCVKTYNEKPSEFTPATDEVRGVGKWVRISGFHLDHEYHPARYQCDQCKHFVDSGDDRNYCPNCGARMAETPKGVE